MQSRMAIEIARGGADLEDIPGRWCIIRLPLGQKKPAHGSALRIHWKGRSRCILVQSADEGFKGSILPVVGLSQPDQIALGIRFSLKQDTVTQARPTGKIVSCFLRIYFIHGQVSYFIFFAALLVLILFLLWSFCSYPSPLISVVFELYSPFLGLFAGLMLMWNWHERIELAKRYYPIQVSTTGGGAQILTPTPLYRLWMRRQEVAIRVGLAFLLLTFLCALAAVILRLSGL